MQNIQIGKPTICAAYYEFYDLLNKATNGYNFYVDPNSSEYQMLDAEKKKQ